MSWPKPDGTFRREFAGDGIVVLPPKQGGRQAESRRVRRRTVVVGHQTMTAFNAHDLLDATAEMGRPGMPY